MDVVTDFYDERVRTKEGRRWGKKKKKKKCNMTLFVERKDRTGRTGITHEGPTGLLVLYMNY